MAIGRTIMLDHRLEESPPIAKRGIPDTFRYLYRSLIDPTGTISKGKIGMWWTTKMWAEVLNWKKKGTLTCPYNEPYRAAASSVGTLEWGHCCRIFGRKYAVYH